MDEIVKAAMAKWPHVPDCYGWLGLDSRGQWWMRDDATQAAGPFAGPQATPASRGAKLTHDKLVEFIGRNYGVDDRGCWYFQNGPQRVFVELAYTPWVWRLEQDLQVMSHTGIPVRVNQWFEDAQGRLLGLADCGWGVLHTQDLVRFVDAFSSQAIVPLQQDPWKTQASYCTSPQALQMQAKSNPIEKPAPGGLA